VRGDRRAEDSLTGRLRENHANLPLSLSLSLAFSPGGAIAHRALSASEDSAPRSTIADAAAAGSINCNARIGNKRGAFIVYSPYEIPCVIRSIIMTDGHYALFIIVMRANAGSKLARVAGGLSR